MSVGPINVRSALKRLMNALLPTVARSFIYRLATLVVARELTRAAHRDGVPAHQAGSFYLLKQFLELCDKSNITVWVFMGTLLGAVRNSGFAGRPGDLDLIISQEDCHKILKILDSDTTSISVSGKILANPIRLKIGCGILRGVGVPINIGVKPRKRTGKVYLLTYFMGRRNDPKIRIPLIELIVKSKVVSEEGVFWRIPATYDDGTFRPILIPDSDFVYCSSGNIHGLTVRVLANAEDYLTMLYGPNWAIPIPTRSVQCGAVT